MSRPSKLGIIGCGKMGSALLKGAIAAKSIDASDVIGFDQYAPSAEALKESTGCAIAASNAELVAAADAVLLCVKPYDLLGILTDLGAASAGKLFISIAAGVNIAAIEGALDDSARVVRVMPNTPAMIGCGASAFSLGTSATSDDADFTSDLLSSVGTVDEVAEKLLDVVTGLSGSGPAYVYTIIEALADGGVLKGLPKDKALQLAAQTVAGAAKMVLETGEHPAALRDQVTSPGGTTIAGLSALESGKLRATLIDAVRAATDRSIELGK